MKRYNLREMCRADIYNYRNDMEFVNTLDEGVRDYLTTYFDNCTDDTFFRFREFNGSESIYEGYFIEKEISFTPTSVLINIERLSLLVQSISVDIVKKLIGLINLLTYYYYDENYDDCDDDEFVMTQIIKDASQNIDKWFLDKKSYIYGSYSLNEAINTGSLEDSISRLNHDIFVSILGFNFPIDTEIDQLLKTPENAVNILVNKRYSNLNFINDLTSVISNKFKFELSM